MNLGVDETDGEQEALSQREKEIIVAWYVG